MNALQNDPVMLIAAAVIGLGLLGLVVEAFLSGMRRGVSGRSPIRVTGDAQARASGAAPAVAAAVDMPTHPRASATREVAPPEPPRDPLVENHRFFTTLGVALGAGGDAPPATLAALHANLAADVFMERMTLAAKAWRPDGFGTGARDLLLKADGTPPDTVAAKVLEGYEQLKLGHVKEALESFLAGIEAAKTAAAADPGNPWPHAWSAFGWRGLALIAEEAGDVQATLAGLKVAYQSMVNAFEVSTQGALAKHAQAA